MARILVVDNYDSFTYNLAQLFGELGAQVLVRRNDEIDLAGIAALAPDHICISPGPGTPEDAGVSNDVIRKFGPRVPLLGVCLGHQCIGQVFGGRIVRAGRLMHGKTSAVRHTGRDAILDGIPSPFEATRYHSLLVERTSIPACLEITAETDEGEIMALRHRSLPIHGVQFHPESILTRHGTAMLSNFLKLHAASIDDGRAA